MNERHVRSAPRSRYVALERVQVDTLQAAAPRYLSAGDVPFLKLDVQGSELEVLEGAGETLQRFVGVQAELSLVRLYEGAPSYLEVCHFLEDAGYRLVGLEPTFADAETGEVLQVDGLFFRRPAA